jgi:hypothetical protein
VNTTMSGNSTNAVKKASATAISAHRPHGLVWRLTAVNGHRRV